MTRIVAILTLLLIVGGCNQAARLPRDADQARRWTAHRPVLPAEEPVRPEAASGKEAPAAKGVKRSEPCEGSSARIPVRSFNTGDCTRWPHYDFPLVIDIEAPEVPPKIAEPAPAIHDS